MKIKEIQIFPYQIEMFSTKRLMTFKKLLKHNNYLISFRIELLASHEENCVCIYHINNYLQCDFGTNRKRFSVRYFE